jgi:membrane protease YdiL (CAAX protease family)
LKLTFTSLGEYPAPLRLAIFVLTLLCLWGPLAFPIYWLVNDPNWESILTMAILYGEFIFLVKYWGKQVYQTPKILNSYGLEFTQRNGQELLKGLTLGLITVMSLLLLEGGLGWLNWQLPDPTSLPRIILEGCLVSLGVGFAEELLFRGWLLDELQRDYSQTASLWADAIIFATLHYIKPVAEMLRNLPAFPGLMLLGLTLVWAKRSCQGRLGLPIGFHGGLVWGYYIINTGQLVVYSHQVSDWFTGIGNNPIAGLMGILFLGIIAVFMRRGAMNVGCRV